MNQLLTTTNSHHIATDTKLLK